MAPGGFSLTLLIPFLRRRSKKYEKLETEEPEKKKQEAALDELARINHKIVSRDMIRFVTIKCRDLSIIDSLTSPFLPMSENFQCFHKIL